MRLRMSAEKLRSDLRSLPFLPIIIVLGHDWNFLAAIREPGKQTV